MKNYITRVLILFFTVCMYAQQGVNYKAVIKDGSGNILATTPVSIRFTIYKGAALTNTVYQETHTPTTDANGLVTINIGKGTIGVTGVFDTIDWGSDDHFLNEKINAGAGIIDMGTTVFKTVPYALYATKVGSITEVQTLADVMALGDSANGQIKNVTDPTNTTDAATKAYVDNETAIFQAAVQSQITDLQNQVAAAQAQLTAITPAVIGDYRNGGIVFWVDPADNTSGLVCALEDQSAAIRWYNGTYVTTGATSVTIGTGSANTDAIITTQGAVQTSYAAGLARAYAGASYNDWFLPSKDELNQMYVHRTTINATAAANGGVALMNDIYWSSTEGTISFAWIQNFSSGAQVNHGKENIRAARAVRAF